MFRKVGSMLLVMSFLFVTIGVVIADDTGNARKGKYLYRKNCRSCHMEGAEGKELSPISKTQAEWQKVFDNRSELPCKDQWAKLSEKDINDMFAHLHGHAFDSPSPAKCK
jgi:mono/diheme cytochrome c family protein